MTPTEICEKLRKRAEIRRRIPRAERDRIADQLEEATNFIEQLGIGDFITVVGFADI